MRRCLPTALGKGATNCAWWFGEFGGSEFGRNPEKLHHAALCCLHVFGFCHVAKMKTKNLIATPL